VAGWSWPIGSARSTSSPCAPSSPVVARYRTEDGEDLSALLAGDDLATAIRRAVAIRGLVIEVHLLPAQRRDLGYRIAARGPTMNA
jgi:hypothetical protein